MSTFLLKLKTIKQYIQNFRQMQFNSTRVFAAVENNEAVYYQVPANAIVTFGNNKRVILVNDKEIKPKKISEKAANKRGCVSVKPEEYLATNVWFLGRYHTSEPEIKTSDPSFTIFNQTIYY